MTGGRSDSEQRVGLCARCRHARRIQSSKGSEFWLCGLAASDPRFKKYPPLPVLRCLGWEAGVPQTPAPA